MEQPILGDRQSDRKEGRGSQLKAVGSDGGHMNVWGTEMKLQYLSFLSRTGGGGGGWGAHLASWCMSEGGN